ncbi:hypothetical protein [Paraburkholderia bryophila]|uniref:Uncharacterized protein n=1 Tax=Paraburkholderia bryophila TaxID=420952 RepID=A0A7Z0B6M8_9BURK|nr:hypothetical protein [Paraburkholderia bryophila]NYH21517.1 hypothetical protein [Paraburkholderia bryophila]
MDRRTFMMSGAWLSSAAAGAAWPSLANADARPNTLAIVDTTLTHGPAFAEYANRLKLPLFDAGDDIGALWYTTLVPLLDRTSLRTQPSLIGLTRASDYFVLKQLATGAGYRCEAHGGKNKASTSQFSHVAFVFTVRPQR